MKSTTLYLIRHGETEWNLQRRIQGHQDTALNETGMGQARLLAQELKNVSFDAVYASPLQRAYQTALCLSSDIQTDVRLREMCFGMYEGLLWTDFYAQLREKCLLFETLGFAERQHFKFHDQVESYLEVYTRARECLDEIVLKHSGEQVAVATHGGLIRSILSTLKQIDPFRIEVRNTGYIILRVEKTQYMPVHYCRVKEGV